MADGFGIVQVNDIVLYVEAFKTAFEVLFVEVIPDFIPISHSVFTRTRVQVFKLIQVWPFSLMSKICEHVRT